MTRLETPCQPSAMRNLTSTNVIGPERRRSSQKITAHVPTPTDHSAKYGHRLETPCHRITFVIRHSRNTTRLCHIHSRPQFSRIAAW